MTHSKPLQKPRLRGHIHQEAFFIALGACPFLLLNSSQPRALLASVIYSLALLLLFGTSALYHRRHWPPQPRALMKRIDHSAFFVFIAGTFTPICLLALPEQHGQRLLTAVWLTATLGIVQALWWNTAPKWLKAFFYVVLGWFAMPYLGELNVSLGTRNLLILATGGAIYTLGAVFYAIKKPRLAPATFGYHEFFHVLTIIGASLHFFVVYQLVGLSNHTP